MFLIVSSSSQEFSSIKGGVKAHPFYPSDALRPTETKADTLSFSAKCGHSTLLTAPLNGCRSTESETQDGKMLESKWKRFVVILWLAGLTSLCLWTPHRGPGVSQGAFPSPRAWEVSQGWGTKYGWSWSTAYGHKLVWRDYPQTSFKMPDGVTVFGVPDSAKKEEVVSLYTDWVKAGKPGPEEVPIPPGAVIGPPLPPDVVAYITQTGIMLKESNGYSVLSDYSPWNKLKYGRWVSVSDGSWYPTIDYGRTALSLVAWSAFMFMAFILLPREVR